MKDMIRNIFLCIVAVLLAMLLIFLLMMASFQAPGWLYGHDDGEAYERYQESMRQYIEENGLSPDIYGYGWEK